MPKQALIMIDMQRGFLDSASPLCIPSAEATVPACAALIDRCHAAGIPVGMCGEFAGDPGAAELLLGMGLDEFSVSTGSMADVRYVVRSLNYTEAQKTAARALKCSTVEEVMEVLNK